MNFLYLLVSLTTIFGQNIETNNYPVDEENLYVKLFKRKRVEQLEAVKNLQRLGKYERQHEMIYLMAEKIFSLIQESRAVLESSSYIPGVSDFPQDEKVRNALSSVLENTALFGEVILRFPNISTNILSRNNNWDMLLQWSIAFCNQVKHLLDNSSLKVLHLVSQELNHIEREENYINPYRKMKQPPVTGTVSDKSTNREKKKLKKGPRLVFHNEL